MDELAEHHIIDKKFAKLAEHYIMSGRKVISGQKVMSGWKVISGQKVMSGRKVMSGWKVIYNKWGKNEVFDELVIYYC